MIIEISKTAAKDLNRIIKQEQLENDALIAIADEAKNDEMLSFDDVTRDLGLNI